MDTDQYQTQIDDFVSAVESSNPHEPEFLQAIKEFAESVVPFVEKNEKYKGLKILERLCEPERVVMFRVVWEDDKHVFHVNKGYRIDFNSAIGPYKGGLRFHPSVNLSVLKFLGFEQTFKNALTTLPIGGGKGGSDFNPKGRSDGEIMRFCQAFMTELHRHIGPNTDVPAGDIGVGGREIGFMFGQYKRICNEFTGVLTGKGPAWGGSCMRPEATGYGVAYFCTEMLKTRGDSLSGKRVVVSGSGNVAQFAVKKCISLGATVLTMSDSSGYIFDPSGITTEKLQWIMELKNVRRGRISEYADHFGDEGSGVEFIPDKRAWSAASKTQVDVALPCATQNEIDESDAHLLVTEGCRCVCEGANMPSTSEAIRVFRSHSSQVLYSPGKASNAGGVATSALEMAQNSQRVSWSCDEVDRRLCEIMTAIHENCHSHGRRPDGSVDYVHGANTAAFVKVADAMLEQGFV